MPETPTDTQLLSKRLHLSGLTPSISYDELSGRLASFGSITALDGLDKLDALGQPRNFAYVTLETTKTQLSRCMNVLSGSTWKGAKLRIGEAKPDFCERILLENASSSAEVDERRARKRRRLARGGGGGVQGRHSRDMSLVTPENVHRRSQWRVTPLGRLIRPMRMRPARPLGPPLDVLKAAAHQPGQQGKRRKKRARAAPPTRARRQTIDPLRWGSTHISGVFLDRGQASNALVASGARGGGGASINRESTEIEADEEVEEILDAPQSPEDDNNDSRATSARPSSSVPSEPAGTELAAEKTRALQLLNSMFGEENEDWGGAESIASDIEQTATESRANVVSYASQSPQGATADFGVVPADQRRAGEISSADRQAQTAPTAQRDPDPDPVHRTSTSKLKDLFAPREEEGFSLIGHLDLDSELDLDLDEPAFANNAPATVTIPNVISYPTPTTPTATTATSAPAQQAKALDASLPFFFPRSSHAKGPVRRVEFERTEDETQIRERWESVRGELTREWKRRHREAVKSRRRRGAGGSERAE